MEQLSNLSETKESLSGDVLKQLHNVSIFNMREKDHFPDENSCIVFAQGIGLIPTTDSEILHCMGNFCRVVMCKSKVGFRFICRNKKPHRKERCLMGISPLQNTFFEDTQLTMPDIFKLVMCFVSRLTMTQVAEQLSFRTSTIIGWYRSFREVCKIVLANEYQRMIHNEGELEGDESHLFLWKYDFGRKRKSDDDISSGNEERNDNYLAESEYRRRYFHNMNMEPLPLEDKFLMFWYHVKLVFPGPGKVGLMYPITDNVDGDSNHVVNDGSNHVVNDASNHLNDSGSMEAALYYAFEETVVELPSKKKKPITLFQR